MYKMEEKVQKGRDVSPNYMPVHLAFQRITAFGGGEAGMRNSLYLACLGTLIGLNILLKPGES